MKKFLNKKNTISLLILSLLLVVLFFSTINKSSYISVINPLNENIALDINGDGIKDYISISSSSTEITINNNKYSLNSIMKDKDFNSSVPNWPTKIFVNKIPRCAKPVLIVQSNKNNNGNIAVICCDNESFNIIYSAEKNIFGILDSNGCRTPKYYSLKSSSGNSSLNSFMIIDNKLLDITNYSKTIPGIDEILSFIDLIQVDYAPSDLPPLFSEDISKNELSLLWNLDKDYYNYSFQDGFFYDEQINSKGIISSIKWRLTFEKYNKGSDDSSKEEKVIVLSSKLTSENSYKISSILLN